MKPNPHNAVIHLAEQLGRERALTQDESMMLERAIRVLEGPVRVSNAKFWSPAEDTMLMKAFRQRKASDVAETLGRSLHSVNSRLTRLRKSDRAKACVRKRIRRADREMHQETGL